MTRTLIMSGVRTPFGKFGGNLRDLSASDLGSIAIKKAIEHANLSVEDIGEVIMGTVLQAGQGQIPSRQAAQKSGLPWEVRTETINKVCASGFRSVTLADQIIRACDEEVIVAGGMESMSNAPYLLQTLRWGSRMGDSEIKDVMIHDGLTCSFTGVHMGVYGNEAADDFQISRKMQDEWAVRSHQRAVAATDDGLFLEEIIPIKKAVRKGGGLTIMEQDESLRRDTSIDALSRLNPIFGSNGTITAGNAPGVNDGAGAIVLMSEERAKKENREPEAVIIGHTSIAVEAKNFPYTPGLAIQNLLKKTGKTVSDIDLFEINEAFAAVVLVSLKMTGIDSEKVNVNGGAVAFGHPIGASGTRIIITLIHELKRRGGGIGIAAICSGGGQGDAIMIEVPLR